MAEDLTSLLARCPFQTPEAAALNLPNFQGSAETINLALSFSDRQVSFQGATDDVQRQTLSKHFCRLFKMRRVYSQVWFLCLCVCVYTIQKKVKIQGNVDFKKQLGKVYITGATDSTDVDRFVVMTGNQLQ